MFILTLDREYDESKNDNYVFLSFVTSRTTMMTTKCSQLSNGKWTAFVNEFDSRYDTIKRYGTNFQQK